MPAQLIVRSRRVVTPGAMGPAAIHMRDGIIAAVTAFDSVPSDAPLFDAGNLVVMPGLVDTHVHINEPGRADWEGFETATRAAAAGGITTVIDMPLNSIPATTTVAALQAKRAAAAGKLTISAGFWGGIVPGNLQELRPLWHAGVFGFKCFLAPSGVAEFAYVGEADLRAALAEIAGFRAPVLVHAELPGPLERAPVPRGSPANWYPTWLASRPPVAETEAIALLVRLCSEFRARIHVVHVSSADSLPILRRAREEGLPITAETCPHYLTFAAEEILDGATEFKCAPPIRDRANREKLWDALDQGLLDLVVSDHSPAPPEMKARDTGDFLQAWGGIASLQLGLPAVWTAARTRGFSIRHVAGWMSRKPARLAGLHARKGAIVPGYDADLVVWNPEARFRVDPARLQHRHKLTPYAGRELRGVVEATFLRGEKVYDRGEFPAGTIGTVLSREQA